MGSTAFPDTTIASKSPAPTMSQEEILIQSSGAMIAVIVIGIIIILTILLIVLKTYHRCTKTSRMLGKAPAKSSSAAPTSMPLGARCPPVSISGAVVHTHVGGPARNDPAGNGFRLPRAEAPGRDGSGAEQLSTISDSTVATVHSVPALEDT